MNDDIAVNNAEYGCTTSEETNSQSGNSNQRLEEANGRLEE